MASFEKFHPVLTAHYTLDWLTQTPVKHVDELLSKPYFSTVAAEKMPAEILETVRDINHIMQKVMNGHELTWGVTDSATGDFKGIITISGFEPNQTTGSLDFTLPQESIGSFSEVIDRAVKFAADHFNFSKLAVRLPQPSTAIAKILEDTRFQQVNATTFEVQLIPD